MGSDTLDLANRFVNETDSNIFLTGKAGTGKTTFLKNLPNVTSKRMIVLAPTGIAAINAGGVTIHSFFQLPFSPYIPGTVRKEGTKNAGKYFKEKQNIIRTLDLLVIDEISMVRADLLDAVDEALRRLRRNEKPFGGVQLLLIGDMQQLPPVVREEDWEILRPYYDHLFFFASHALKQAGFVTVELTKIYRQTDTVFINILNKIRTNTIDRAALELINSRFRPDFNPDEVENLIVLTTHNNRAQLINQRRMEEIPEACHTFHAEIEGNFPDTSYPTEETLTLKLGAQVMFVKNDSTAEKRYYNGKIGKITAISDNRLEVTCHGEEQPIEVDREEWCNVRYSVDDKTHEIVEVTEGTFKQYPLKPAWAITIHKSQGLTFDSAYVEAGAAFAPGQVYVALSRCKTMEGLYLGDLLRKENVFGHNLIDHFSKACEDRYAVSSELLARCRRDYYKHLLSEMFDFGTLSRFMQELVLFVRRNFETAYPTLVSRLGELADSFRPEVERVGERFNVQLAKLIDEASDYENDVYLRERVTKGIHYFSAHLKTLYELLEESLFETDNKEVEKRYNQLMLQLAVELNVKRNVLVASSESFSVSRYVKVKATVLSQKTVLPAHAKRGKAALSDDIVNPELYNKLRRWRHAVAQKENVPAYFVLRQTSLVAIANRKPQTEKALLAIPQVGKVTVQKYGAELLAILREAELQ